MAQRTERESLHSNNRQMKPVIAVTMGDPAGIGPEVCIKAVAGGKAGFCHPVIVGAGNVLENLIRVIELNIGINTIKNVRDARFKRKQPDILDVGGVQLNKLVPGKISAMCGLASINYVRQAVALAVDGKVDAIVTAPINKTAVHRAKLEYKGHTELLSEIFRTQVVMIFVSRNLRIAVVTRHLPIRHVSRAITKERILDTIRIIYENRRLLGFADPSFAILSLNPHAGEGGILGEDEKKKIMPAIKEAKESGIRAEGPFPADGFFGAKKEKDFDIIVAMYHDQGLIPYKMKAFGHGVNVTLGLPIIRTSVDHGTAFDIAGKGAANPSGLIEAMRLASLMVRRKKVNCDEAAA